jgi:hypothetical protein
MFHPAVILLLITTVTAAPSALQRYVYSPCYGLYGTAQRYARGVLGVGDLECGNPDRVPVSRRDFDSSCAR